MKMDGSRWQVMLERAFLRSKRALLVLGAGCMVTAVTSAQADIEKHASAAIVRLSNYLQIDTVNPPGNESRGVEYLGTLLAAAGIPFETVESAPGRGNLWARLEGSPDAEGNKQPGLILLHHIDVVPANRAFWSFEPLSGDVKNGFVYGRGAIDTKGLGIAQLQAFIALAESGQKLNRDVLLLATADEEAGGFYGAGWLIENRAELFDGMGYVLNEGGSGRAFGDDIAVMVEVTQKVPLWLRLTATGRPGHGSAPQTQTSVTQLVRGLKRVSETEFPVNVIDPVARMFEGLAPYQNGKHRSAYANLQQAVQDTNYLLEMKLINPAGHALLRNTCSITVLEGSPKINVVPAQAHAELDCRLLPDQDPQEFKAELARIINDPTIEMSEIMSFSPAVSRTDTPLFKVLERISDQEFSAPVIPTVAGGFTDSHFFRDIGITSYGYSPFAYAPGEFVGVHGNDERLSTATLVRGVGVLYQVLENFTVQN
ncbi:MAG TPA: peptidase M20 [Gammaproteobacteria bacterium]|nr:peptidase M20 [Gammaproteobacteria bacterium]|tara:strand:- start:2052 stop:3503 length:1452 start_codon:yes stop_codon:yes gene_type:complete